MSIVDSIDIFYIILFMFILIILFLSISTKNEKFKLKVTLYLSFSFLVIFLFIFYKYSLYNIKSPYILCVHYKLFENWNIHYLFAIDTLSYTFILLSLFLKPLVILTSWNNLKTSVNGYLITLVFLIFLLINVFGVLDLFLFYVFFESILIPMYFLIGIWGSRSRKIHAANLFFLYTFIGSIPCLLSILYILNTLNTTNFFALMNFGPLFPNYIQCFLWIGIFLSFAVKVPMYPFHIWLPEAHVEASTGGSIILAGIMLKLGTYGIVRFLLPVLPLGTIMFRGAIMCLCVFGIIYVSLLTIRQIDLKKIIAYSSVANMNFVVLGLLCSNIIGVGGSVFLMLSHGIVSSGLFFCIGILYDRFKTRILFYFQGIVNLMPLYSVFLLLLTLSNISFPLTSGFIGEILIFIGLFFFSPSLTFLSALGVILGAIYSIWLFNRIIYGSLNKKFNKYIDINYREFVCLNILILLIIYLGIAPNFILKLISDTIIIDCTY